LKDVAITFHHELILGHDLSVRFIVGVNGSGKTRLLQAIAEIFLNLSLQRLPPFPVRLAYDIGIGGSQHTIFLNHSDDLKQTTFIEFDRTINNVDWEIFDADSDAHRDRIRNSYRGGELPGSGSIESYLPRVLLSYTSGNTSKWENIFSPRRAETDSIINNYSSEKDERPLGWSNIEETQYRTSADPDLKYDNGESRGSNELTIKDNINTANICIFINEDYLKLIFCSVILHNLAEELDKMRSDAEKSHFVSEINESIENGNRMCGLRGILNEVDWLWPITACLKLKIKSENLNPRQNDLITNLSRIATDVIHEPKPGPKHNFIFDLHRSVSIDKQTENCVFTGDALIEAITGHHDATPFDIFHKLYNMKQEGLLVDLILAFHKRNIDALLVYDWLSDGEQLFLGRMALFHMLQFQDNALILLDEPDTHLNDFWKREIVDIIDENMQDTTSDILIATHSSIALTDVFDTEIILLEKNKIDGSITSVRTPIRTFGASPNEIMRNIFNAPESVGQRASEYLDLVLMLAAYPNYIETIWLMERDKVEIVKCEIFQKLKSKLTDLCHNCDNEVVFENRLFDVLNSLREYAKKKNPTKELKVVDILSELEDKIGPGFYQFEIRRRLRILKESDPIAT
jgi:hypothetical protein